MSNAQAYVREVGDAQIAERIGLDAVAEAHVRLERGSLEGKIILVPST